MIFLWAILVFVGLLVGLSGALIVAERLLVNYGLCKLDINAGERELEVQGGQTLLEALNGAEIWIPSACGGKGSCGYCKLRVLSGGGEVLPTETPFLNRREIRAGTRLACQVKVRQDMTLRIPEDLLNVKLYLAVVASTRDLTYDIKEIRFALSEPAEISQRPGQYVQIIAPSPEGPVSRAYSVSSPSYVHDEVELNVRIIPGGIGSTYLHNLTEGDQVNFTGPYGEFELNEDPATEIICVGGGCGMAPMKNIIYTLYERWPQRSCWLFFGCRTTKDIFYLDELKALAAQHPGFHVVYALSDQLGPDEQWDGETGFIHLSVDKMLEPGIRRQAFLCGPPPMIEAVTEVLKEKGLRDRNIFYDKF
ncbi:MAG TPA: FAD-binding oxidoreductase [Phycisphaerae bacterium]|nr:FAD-binding oxidoreductase [Phycisphaerae bacterium]HUU21725.1 FAD-binding oxidoreductase [Phycisphaerae bacterium]